MDPDAPSPASVLLQELKEQAAPDALEPDAGALAGVTGAGPDGSELAGHERRTGRGPGPPTRAVSSERLSDCAESAGASRGDHEVGAWTSMLDVDDDRDVIALLARALDETPEGFETRPARDRAFEPDVFLHRRAGAAFDPRRAHPYHGGVTRGVVSQLRRAHTVGAYPQTHGSTTRDALVRTPHGTGSRTESRFGPFDPSRRPDVSGALPTRAPDWRDDSLVDRLRVSVGDGVHDGIRRARSSPACHDAGGAGNGDPRAAGVAGVAPFCTRAAAAAAEPLAASGSRPFGFLGVTRPPWHTRWEAHLEVPAAAESGAAAAAAAAAGPTRVFLGAFDAKESAARAHDAAKIKLFGPPPACGALNFPAEEYLEALAEMRACDFPEFVRSLVRHGHAGERRLSRFRGVHAAPDGKWEARLEREEEA